MLSEQICSHVVPRTRIVPTQYANGFVGSLICVKRPIPMALSKKAMGKVSLGDTLSVKMPMRGLKAIATTIEQSMRLA